MVDVGLLRWKDQIGIALALAASSYTELSQAQVLVIADPLTGSTLGAQNGGDLLSDGWHVNGIDNYLYWHVPTLPHGAVEFSVRGIRPAESRPGNEDKADLFHMYDFTFDNADTNYFGYRNNPFKHFIRKTGVLDTRPARTDSLELLWQISPGSTEPDSPVLSWDPNLTYRFREEWGPDGAGNSVINTYRDGVLLMTISQPGSWAPAGHSIRIGMAKLTPEEGAPLDAVFSDLRVYDLSMSVMLPGVDPAPPDALPVGPVRVVGNSLVDDNGAFLGLGATYMTGLWQAKNDHAQLESDLALFRSSGFNYVRVLGQVAGDFWAGLEIAPVECRNDDGTVVPPWPDYIPLLQDLLDTAWAHGMRTQITIFGSAGHIEAGSSGRQASVDLVLQAIAGREDKVILIEVANEGWHTGFPGAAGLDEMRALGEYLDAATNVPVAITSNHGANTIQEVYAGTSADIATWHTSRDLGVDDGWGPVRDPWTLDPLPGVPPVSSNEPVGPGSSVASESRPIHLVMAAAFAYVAKLPMYVFHSSAGVRHRERFEDMAGLSDYREIRHLLPGDIASWARNDGKEASAPFSSYAGGQADRYWPEVGSQDGCAGNIGARKGDRFVSIPIGIRPGGLLLQARQAISFQAYDPISAALFGDFGLAAGEQITLPQGSGAYVLTNLELSSSPFGLLGEYFDAADFTSPALSRRDSTINFDWGGGSPSSSLQADTFSVRWRGFLQPRYRELYTFTMASDDGTRVWIDDRLVIDDWTDHGADVVHTGTIALEADRLYPIRVEYYENLGSASVRLSWSSASQSTEVLPRDRLTPPRDNAAAFIAQDVPSMMEAGQSYWLSITMRNTGVARWTMAEGHRLGSQSPENNQVFDVGRVDLSPGEEILPGALKTFSFEVRAPEALGSYDFQRQMLQESVEWFGDRTPLVHIEVVAGALPPAPDAGTPTNMQPGNGDGGVLVPTRPPAMNPPSMPAISDGSCSCTSHSRRASVTPLWLIGILLLRSRRFTFR